MKFLKFIFAYTIFLSLPILLMAQNANWQAPQEADTLQNPYTINQTLISFGETTFKANCVTCHGTKGKGNGPAAVALNPRPANLQAKDVQQESLGDLFWKVSNGRNGMPAWENGLSEKQRWAVVTYVKSLTNSVDNMLTQNQNHGK